MSVVISQSLRAAFPDRNLDGAGLLAEMQPGAGGQFIDIQLGATTGRLFSRFVFAGSGMSDGACTVAGAVAVDGSDAWLLRYDASGHELILKTSGGGSARAALPGVFLWSSIEVGYDLPGAVLSLWINGQAAASMPLSMLSPAVTRAYLGVIQKDDAATGELHFDEWITRDRYIGSVAVEPTRDYADDPARWLVLYNTSSTDSVRWAEAYRRARKVPYANCLGLELSQSESIGAAEYDAMRSAIEVYLDQNGLRDQVMGILVGYRVPGYVVPTGSAFRIPVPSLLHHPQTHFFSIPNPVATETIETRPTSAELGRVRLTARIDAPDLTTAKRLHERALELADLPLSAADQLHVDTASPGFTLPTWAQRVRSWYQGLDRQRLRIRSHLNGRPDAPNDSPTLSIDRDSFFWGWGPAEPPAGFFADPAGPRVACVQLRTIGVDATTLRSSTPSHWIDTALGAGYAAAVGTSTGSSSSSLLYARSFFEALRRGWSLAEAYILSLPRVQDGYYLVGDPLLCVTLPKAGWDVFGPLSRTSRLNPDAPAASLPIDETSQPLPPEQQPPEGQTGVYLVRRVDGSGRSDASLNTLRIARCDGRPVSAAPPIA
ncbi:MAG: hypothetical protein AAGL98_03810, partial [Planctomycetota bacterium]